MDPCGRTAGGLVGVGEVVLVCEQATDVLLRGVPRDKPKRRQAGSVGVNVFNTEAAGAEVTTVYDVAKNVTAAVQGREGRERWFDGVGQDGKTKG